MVDREIDSLAKLDRALHYWRNFSFSKAHFNLDEAMKAIGTEDQNVEAFMDYPGRWVLTRVGETTPKAATFHTACVWRWGSDLETGNYVPPGETPPGKLLESRIQSEPGALCQFSYAVDTVHDKSLWNVQQKVEEYILQVKGFNRSKKPRRPWQDGSENNTSVYIMGSQMFFKRTKSTSRREASVKYKLHPWIEKVAKQSAWFPNPDRPVVLEPCNGVLRDINDSVPPYLRTGDLVWISFFVEFVIGINHWSTTFSPREIIRVGTVSSELVGDQPPGITLLEGSEDRLRAGDKISIPEDFPMHLFESPLDAATSSVVQDTAIRDNRR